MADSILTQQEESRLREFRDRMALGSGDDGSKAAAQLGKASTDPANFSSILAAKANLLTKARMIRYTDREASLIRSQGVNLPSPSVRKDVIRATPPTVESARSTRERQMSNSGPADGEERIESVPVAEGTSHVKTPTTSGNGPTPGATGRYMPTYSLVFGGAAAMMAAALLGIGYFSKNVMVVLAGLALFTLATVILVVLCLVIIYWIVRNFPSPGTFFKRGPKVPPDVEQGVTQP